MQNIADRLTFTQGQELYALMSRGCKSLQALWKDRIDHGCHDNGDIAGLHNDLSEIMSDILGAHHVPESDRPSFDSARLSDEWYRKLSVKLGHRGYVTMAEARAAYDAGFEV